MGHDAACGAVALLHQIVGGSDEVREGIGLGFATPLQEPVPALFRAASDMCDGIHPAAVHKAENRRGEAGVHGNAV